MLFITVLSAALSIACLGPLTKIELVSQLDWYAPPVCCMGVFVLGLVIMQTLANYLFPPRLNLPKRVDKVAGSLLGVVNAYFLTGFLMAGFALFPGTGDPADKVIFLGADAFFAKSMEWMSARAGSGEFSADEFLRETREEKIRNSVRERKEDDVLQEYSECAIRLDLLGKSLKACLEANGNRYPEKIEDLFDYHVRRKTSKSPEPLMTCPATGLYYQLFQVEDFGEIERLPTEDREKYILIYERGMAGQDALRYGHLGFRAKQRPALCADFKVHWFGDTDMRGLLRGQRAAMESK
jgi:hypothetical protein